MLVYYILSRGQHPFGKGPRCEVNILEGRYSLEHLDDDVAKDLIEWMINEDPNERPTVEQTLCNLYTGRNSPEGGQLKNQQPSKSPSSASAQKRAFSSCCGTKGMCGNASQRHSFIS